jgi:sodium/potassium-transporting ATPase subunit alpha
LHKVIEIFGFFFLLTNYQNFSYFSDNALETANLVFFGTLMKEGKGKGIVVRIGARTVLAQIASVASSGEKVKTPLRIELDRFVLIITVIALVLGVIFFFSAKYAVGYSWTDCIVFGIGIIVANVPEGLLGCITISLAITAKRLHAKHVLVKNLESVETLGSTSCICSDKTGTLTQNKMTVENVWYDDLKRRALNR